MKEIYTLCFYGGLILAILLFITAVVLFIVLKIPRTIGDLTGRNAKKSIENMQKKKQNSSEVSRKEQAKYYNQNTGKIKVKTTVSPETRKENRDNTTDLLDTNKVAPKFKQFDYEQTDVLGSNTDMMKSMEEADKAGDMPTDVLSDNKIKSNQSENPDDMPTDVLTDNTIKAKVVDDSDGDEATDVLRSPSDDGDADDEATDVLRSTSDDEDDDADDEATDVLRSTSDDEDDEDADDEAIDVLRSTSDDKDDDEEATDVLRGAAYESDDEEATNVLRSEMPKTQYISGVKVVCNIVVTHTNESI